MKVGSVETAGTPVDVSLPSFSPSANAFCEGVRQRKGKRPGRIMWDIGDSGAVMRTVMPRGFWCSYENSEATELLGFGMTIVVKVQSDCGDSEGMAF
jgi:hypothetical protein